MSSPTDEELHNYLFYEAFKNDVGSILFFDRDELHAVRKKWF